eukprot:2927664-Rhodomonas_salina.1
MAVPGDSEMTMLFDSCGTVAPYLPTRCAVLACHMLLPFAVQCVVVRSGMLLRMQYTIRGTEVEYGATHAGGTAT